MFTKQPKSVIKNLIFMCKNVTVLVNEYTCRVYYSPLNTCQTSSEKWTCKRRWE